MKRALVPPLLCLLLSATPAMAVPYTTFGAPDCGQWVTEPAATRKAWLLGFLSGMAVLHARIDLKPSDPLNFLSSAEQAFAWMDNYCTRNPLNSVTEGAAVLFDEISSRKK